MVRDPDLVQIIDDLQTRLAALEANTVARWGRIPHVAADPATLADGMDWIRSDTSEWRYRANGATIALDGRYAALGLNAAAAEQAATGTSPSTVYTTALGGSPGVNPAVTVTTRTTAIVTISCQIAPGTFYAMVGVAISGATTIAATDGHACLVSSPAGGAELVITRTFLLTGLTPGSNTFTLQYKVNGGAGATFLNRSLVVIPL